jgi:glycine cleavage system H protein
LLPDGENELGKGFPSATDQAGLGLPSEQASKRADEPAVSVMEPCHWRFRPDTQALSDEHKPLTTMSSGPLKTLHYKRATFATQLPVDFRYSPSHAWAGPVGEDRWRVGLTKFATRMLGEMVDHGIDVEAGAAVAPGQILGWVEGFKAISDLYCIGAGQFAGRNPALLENIKLISKEPYTGGWLYEMSGRPDDNCMDVTAYRDLLDRTIDRILAQQKAAEGKETT